MNIEELILGYENIEKWFNRTIHSDQAVSQVLRKIHDDFTEEFSLRLN